MDVAGHHDSLRRQTFESAIIGRYRRRESWVKEALIEMYPTGISVRRVEDITEALWGTRVSPSTVFNLNKNLFFLFSRILLEFYHSRQWA